MADYLIKGETLTAIADSLRSVGKFSSRINPTSMPKYISGNLVSYGVVDSILDRTIESIDNHTCTFLGPHAFDNCVFLNKVYMDRCDTIGVEAFAGCLLLQEVDMNLCRNISESAFLGCLNLTTINMPNCTNIEGSSTFYNCKPKKVTMGVQSITSDSALDKMLYKNENLEELYLPQCQFIYSNTMLDCANLIKVEAPKVELITQQAFYRCYSLKEIDFPELGTPSSTTRKWDIGEYAFASCSALEKVSIPKVKSINDYCFANCTSLKEFYAPCLSNYGSDPFTGVTTLESFTEARTTIKDQHVHWPNLKYYSNSVATSITSYTFYQCSQLTEDNFYAPNLLQLSYCAFGKTGFRVVNTDTFPNMSYLNAAAFGSCQNLVCVDLPQLQSGTGSHIFINCFSLEYVSLPNITSVSTSHPMLGGCNALKYANLKTLETIHTGMFSNKAYLTSINIAGATKINKNAFSGCTSLSTINLPQVTNISEQAFLDCNNLTAVTIGHSEPSGILIDPSIATPSPTVAINANAFMNCTNLQSLYIYCSSDTLPTLNAYAFSNAGITSSTGSIFVPAEKVEAYKSAKNWSTYADRIFPLKPAFRINGTYQHLSSDTAITWSQWISNYTYQPATDQIYTYPVYIYVSSVHKAGEDDYEGDYKLYEIQKRVVHPQLELNENNPGIFTQTIPIEEKYYGYIYVPDAWAPENPPEIPVNANIRGFHIDSSELTEHIYEITLRTNSEAQTPSPSANIRFYADYFVDKKNFLEEQITKTGEVIS